MSKRIWQGIIKHGEDFPYCKTRSAVSTNAYIIFCHTISSKSVFVAFLELRNRKIQVQGKISKCYHKAILWLIIRLSIHLHQNYNLLIHNDHWQINSVPLNTTRCRQTFWHQLRQSMAFQYVNSINPVGSGYDLTLSISKLVSKIKNLDRFSLELLWNEFHETLLVISEHWFR